MCRSSKLRLSRRFSRLRAFAAVRLKLSTSFLSFQPKSTLAPMLCGSLVIRHLNPTRLDDSLFRGFRFSLLFQLGFDGFRRVALLEGGNVAAHHLFDEEPLCLANRGA